MLPVIQYTGAEGVLDLGWGHPDPALLPVEAWAESTSEAIRAAGWTALTIPITTPVTVSTPTSTTAAIAWPRRCRRAPWIATAIPTRINAE